MLKKLKCLFYGSLYVFYTHEILEELAERLEI